MMDERIDAFLKDVQELEGLSLTTIRDGVGSYLAVYENLVCDTEPDPNNREVAAQACHKPCPRARDTRAMCRGRVAEEMRRRTGTLTADH
jgi:hypothetical protein